MSLRLALLDWATRHLHRPAVVPAVRKALDLRDGARLLDLGGGTGAAAELLAHKGEVVVVEPEARKVAYGRARRPGLRFVEAGAEQLPFPEFHFDGVMALVTLHHWSDAERGLAEVHRVLRRDGRFVVYEMPPSRARWLARIEARLGHGAHFVEPEELATMLHKAGFGKVEFQDAPRGYVAVTSK